jgi:2-polyprenyl-6-methoxyphenol hydroxylase-like FAD-dependent oxidoreductase
MEYDLVIAGGGVAGAALAWTMSKAGARVLVVEREGRFRDRVRGEGMHPWGVAEAERLGLAELLRARCARPARYWNTHVAGTQVARRDLEQTTPVRVPGLNVHHPELQETLLRAAAEAGAEVRRGAYVEQVIQGERPTCRIVDGAGAPSVSARLVVAADGRSSALRAALAFPTFETPSPMRVSGLLLENTAELGEQVDTFFPPTFGCLALVFPLPGKRMRMYLAANRALELPAYSGPQAVSAFVEHCCSLGVPRAWLEHARAGGPLASFDSHAAGATHPALDGVVLLGDAAGHVDPAFGCGLSLALRDVRVLADHLRASSDWSSAAHAYARERSRYYRDLLRIEGWLTELLYGLGTESDALRARALPRVEQLGVDVIGAGPDSRCDEATRLALFS